LDCPEGELSILLVDNDRIQALNREYRQKDTPTNVLSFPMREGDFAEVSPGLLGDVVISVDRAAAEAVSADISLGDRMTWLLIHGILHLFGFDHEKSDAAEEEMEIRTKELQQKVAGLLSEDLQ
jgi:probable rRNA maturation factor